MSSDGDYLKALDDLAPEEWGPETAMFHCRLHLHTAFAARFLPDPDLAHGHLDRAEDLVEHLRGRDVVWVRTRILATRAELWHYHEGDLDAALDLLSTDDPELDRAMLFSHRVSNLIYGGRHLEARETVVSGARVLRRAWRRLRDRMTTAEALLLTAEGKPKVALRKLTVLAARHRLTGRRAMWLGEELRAAYVVAALSSDGPSAFPVLEKRLGSAGDDDYQPDLVTFYYARAGWEYARGNIDAAARLATLSLDAAETHDPSGMALGPLSLAAELAALRGEQARTLEWLGEFDQSPWRSAAVVAGTVRLHEVSAQFLLKQPGAGETLLRLSEEFAAAGQYGFAAQTLRPGCVLAGSRG